MGNEARAHIRPLWLAVSPPQVAALRSVGLLGFRNLLLFMRVFSKLGIKFGL